MMLDNDTRLSVERWYIKQANLAFIAYQMTLRDIETRRAKIIQNILCDSSFGEYMVLTTQQSEHPDICPGCNRFLHHRVNDGTPQLKTPECEETQTDVEVMQRMGAIEKWKKRKVIR